MTTLHNNDHTFVNNLLLNNRLFLHQSCHWQKLSIITTPNDKSNQIKSNFKECSASLLVAIFGSNSVLHNFLLAIIYLFLILINILINQESRWISLNLLKMCKLKLCTCWQDMKCNKNPLKIKEIIKDLFCLLKEGKRTWVKKSKLKHFFKMFLKKSNF